MNRLAQQKSLYLKQHQENPVDWWPYSAEALALAQKLNKPIFLSIGYSSCHWCHVMAHESFEDEVTAKILNESFVSIKLDREEFPDLDQYYQEVCQLLGRNGGWPLSVFLTPEMGPFFVGTYFPLEGRQGMPSFKDVLEHLKKIFVEKRPEIEKDAAHIQEVLKAGVKIKERIQLPGPGHFPHPQTILKAIDGHMDKKHGGLGGAPKFPHFSFLEWGVEQMLEGHIQGEEGKFMLYSLERLLAGGIFDQARGGIHRYSTDEEWLVPHFEKMLYDQAGLLKVLAKATVLGPRLLVLDALMDTLLYLEKEMKSEEGLFFSAQDADSEGEEGIYFTFSRDEFRQALQEHAPEVTAEIENIERWFSITQNGNFEHQLNMISLNHQHLEEIQKAESWQIIRKVKRALFKARQERIPPLTDTKAICSWNFHLISALCDVAQFCGAMEIRQKARELLDQAMKEAQKSFYGQVGLGLKHVSTLEETPAYFEDYANHLEACLRYYEISGEEEYKKIAQEQWTVIVKNFVQENKIFTRALTGAEQPYPNLPLKFFDHSYRSAAATFVGLGLRLSVLFADQSWRDNLAPLLEECMQMTLANPLASGESLRFMTYPQEVYKKLQVPRSFLSNAEFLRLRSHLPQRFVLDYHQDDQEFWQVCSLNSCEKSGKGLQELFRSLSGGAE